MAFKPNALVCTAFFLCGASFARAADLPPLPQDETTYRKSWTSFSIGIGGGLGSVNTKLEATPGPGVTDPSAAGTNLGVDGLGTDGGFVSISGGADYQLSNRVVVGLFVDGDFTNMSSNLHAIIPENPLEVHGSVGINDKISVGARLGYLFWPTSLWYVSAGYTRVDFDNVKVSIQADTNISAAIDVPALSGGFVGVGSETLLTDNISLKAEFRYTDFGSGKLGFPTIDGTNLNDFVNARLSPTMQEGRLSINYRIN
jgi:outer membrane immunogenic protein